MAGSNFFTKSDFNPNVQVALTNSDSLVVFGSFTGSAPTNSGKFAVSALLLFEDSGALYQNVGTVNSPNFQLIGSGGGGISGSGTAGQVTVWDGASSVTGFDDYTYVLPSTLDNVFIKGGSFEFMSVPFEGSLEWFVDPDTGEVVANGIIHSGSASSWVMGQYNPSNDQGSYLLGNTISQETKIVSNNGTYENIISVGPMSSNVQFDSGVGEVGLLSLSATASLLNFQTATGETVFVNLASGGQIGFSNLAGVNYTNSFGDNGASISWTDATKTASTLYDGTILSTATDSTTYEAVMLLGDSISKLSWVDPSSSSGSLFTADITKTRMYHIDAIGVILSQVYTSDDRVQSQFEDSGSNVVTYGIQNGNKSELGYEDSFAGNNSYIGVSASGMYANATNQVDTSSIGLNPTTANLRTDTGAGTTASFITTDSNTFAQWQNVTDGFTSQTLWDDNGVVATATDGIVTSTSTQAMTSSEIRSTNAIAVAYANVDGVSGDASMVGYDGTNQAIMRALGIGVVERWGGIRDSVVTSVAYGSTTNLTLQQYDIQVGASGSGATTINLPTGTNAPIGTIYIIKDFGGAGVLNLITIDAGGGNTIHAVLTAQTLLFSAVGAGLCVTLKKVTASAWSVE